MLNANCETTLHTVKLHILDLSVEIPNRFQFLELLSSSAYKRINVNFKQAFLSNLQHCIPALQKTLPAVGMITRSRK